MKQPVYTEIAFLLLCLLSLLGACSNIEQIEPAPRHERKVTLSVDVGVASTAAGSDTDPGTSEENKIHTLYVFVYNQGTNSYCEAQRFNAYNLEETSQGNYHFEMEVTPGNKRFYLIANPQTDLRSDLTSYTQEELQNLKMAPLSDHKENKKDHRTEDQLQSTLATRGLPMSMSIRGTTTPSESGSDKATLTLEDNSSAFTLIRAVAKVQIICKVNKEVTNGTLNMEKLAILQANRSCYLLPKYKIENNRWIFDWPAMMEGADLSRTVEYEFGKQEHDHSPNEWIVFDRGTHYLYENYFGKSLSTDAVDGLADPNRNSKIQIVLSDGRNKTYDLAYLPRNHFLVVTFKIWATNINCEVTPWTEEVVYPDYKEQAP